MLIVDAHLDLAYEALRFNRDLRLDVATIRERETRRASHPNGTITTTVPAMLEGGVGIAFATLFAMPESMNTKMPANTRLVYRNSEEAARAASEQLDYYHRLADEEERVRLVGDLASLDEVVSSHDGEDVPLLGFVPLMEGADAVREPEALEMWYERGVRLIGPAWNDTRYAPGAWGAGGGFTAAGHHLLEVMGDLDFILDISHLAEKATFEAFERYDGVVVATHANARSLVPGMRQLSDVQIERLAERDGVIGVVLYNRFLREGYHRTDRKESVTLSHVVAHIDYICQLLGDAQHVGIGSDLDGGFGAEHTPAEIDTIADLQKIAAALAERGYEEEDITAIMGGNWIGRLRVAFS
jgi:membrane dipeptidase